MSIPSVHERLAAMGEGVSQKTVYKHVNELRVAGFVRRVRGTKSPALYERGEKAAILDDLARGSSHPPIHPLNGGGPIVQYCYYPDKNPSSDPSDAVYIPTAEAHVNGRYIYPVTHVGELYGPFRVRDEQGEISECVVWEPEPRQLRGVQYYCGHVPIHGGINIQYWEGREPAVHIWPTPVELIPGRVHEAEGDLAARAQDVANWLGRYGGWRLGEGRFASNEGDAGIHYAVNDPAIVGNIPTGYQPASETGYYTDGTPGPLSVETKGPGAVERAEALVNFAGITRTLRRDQADIRRDLAAALDAKAEAILQLRHDMLDREMTLWEALSSLVDLQHHAVDAIVRSETIRSSMMTGQARDQEQTGAEASSKPDSDNGGMYQ